MEQPFLHSIPSRRMGEPDQFELVCCCIPKYRHYDIAYRYIIVPNNLQTLCCRCKKACFSGFETRNLSLLIKKRDLSVCLSGYTFRHALMSHADILDSDRGHNFRKHRHKNNKKIAVIYEKMVKNRPLPRYLPASCYVDKERVRI